METLRKTLNEEVWPLLFFPFGTLALLIFPIIVGIYDAIHINNPSYALHLVSAILSPLEGGYIALVYTLDRDTLKRLTYSNLVATMYRRKRDAVQDCPAEVGRLSDSVSSHELSQSHYRKFVDTETQVLLQNPTGSKSSLK